MFCVTKKGENALNFSPTELFTPYMMFVGGLNSTPWIPDQVISLSSCNTRKTLSGHWQLLRIFQNQLALLDTYGTFLHDLTGRSSLHVLWMEITLGFSKCMCLRCEIVSMHIKLQKNHYPDNFQTRYSKMKPLLMITTPNFAFRDLEETKIVSF